MKTISLFFVAAIIGILLSGCVSTVDKERVEQQLAAAADKVAKIEAFIVENKPVVEQLGKLADQTGDETLKAAAAKLRATVDAAIATLPTAKTELETIKTTVSQLQADANGKVPWYAIAGGLALQYVPRIASMIFPQLAPLAALFANLTWSATATKKQKDDEADILAKAKAA